MLLGSDLDQMANVEIAVRLAQGCQRWAKNGSKLIRPIWDFISSVTVVRKCGIFGPNLAQSGPKSDNSDVITT